MAFRGRPGYFLWRKLFFLMMNIYVMSEKEINSDY